MRKTERNGENWFIVHLQCPNGNCHRIDDDDDYMSTDIGAMMCTMKAVRF